MLLLSASHHLLPRRHFQAACVTTTTRTSNNPFKINKPLPLAFVLLQVLLRTSSLAARGAANPNPFRLPHLVHNQTGPHSILIAHQSQSQNPNQRQRQQHNTYQARPDSSSSFFADIEDLNDSSIRTRTGTHQEPPTEAGQVADFDQLIERILQPLAGHGVFSPQQQALVSGFNGHGSTVAADANNKTTMRFFRNNKTFASIVYTNEASSSQADHKPRKLINCHLVDLEKHSSDVALFEAKYEIKTVDIEFSQMMSIIEACTNIARFKPLRAGVGGGASAAAQLFAAALPASPLNGAAFRPMVVVGRPMASPLPSAAEKRREQLQATFQALDRDLLGGGSDAQHWAPAPEAQSGQRFKRRLAAAATPIGAQAQLELAGARKPGLLAQALARVAEPRQRPAGRLDQAGLDNKRLVLGEVTPSAQLVANKSGGIKEALQEITSYDTTDLMSIWRGILPGTNWCGMGDRATSYNDLGFESDIDICCRAHDFCPIRLSAFSAGYGLFNWSFYTRSHCRCDQNFLDCLERAESPLAAVVLRFYFTIMKTTCLHDSETNKAGQPQQQETGRSTSAALSQQTARHRQPPSEPPGSATQTNLRIEPAAQSNLQRRLLDQLRKSLPIPALRLSQTLRTELDRH